MTCKLINKIHSPYRKAFYLQIIRKFPLNNAEHIRDCTDRKNRMSSLQIARDHNKMLLISLNKPPSYITPLVENSFISLKIELVNRVFSFIFLPIHKHIIGFLKNESVITRLRFKKKI